MPFNFNPDKDVPDLSGKVILITGGTAGIGTQTIRQLAKHSPAEIYFSGRNTAQAKSLIDSLQPSCPKTKLIFLQCDLTSFASIKAAVDATFTSDRLDIVICNAGIMAVPPAVTKEGYEIQFGTNHMGHAYLLKLLRPTLLKTAELPNSDVRIIGLSSFGHKHHPKGGIVFKDLHSPQDNILIAGGFMRYGQSKLAILLYTTEFARHYPQITSISIHPGVIKTGMVTNAGFMERMVLHAINIGNFIEEEEGTYNTLWAATSDKLKIVNGGYYDPVGVPAKKDPLVDGPLAAELWEWTEKELEGH